jgi:hypothetical protein
LNFKLKTKIKDLSVSNRLVFEWSERKDDTLSLGVYREDQSFASKYKAVTNLRALGGLELAFQAKFKTIDSNLVTSDTSKQTASFSLKKSW